MEVETRAGTLVCGRDGGAHRTGRSDAVRKRNEGYVVARKSRVGRADQGQDRVYRAGDGATARQSAGAGTDCAQKRTYAGSSEREIRAAARGDCEVRKRHQPCIEGTYSGTSLPRLRHA